MSLFAFTMSPAVRDGLQNFVEGLFIVFVVASFVSVAVYAARQIAARKLLAPENAPLPLKIRPPFLGWLFLAGVLGLIYLPEIISASSSSRTLGGIAALLSAFFPCLVLLGLAAMLLQNRRTVEVQFGFNRLPVIRAQVYALVVFGAVMLIETPLSDASASVLDFFQVPHPEQNSVETFRQFSDPSVIFWFMFQAVVFNPVIEELFFRGFLLTFLKNFTSPVLAIALSGGVFAFAHLNLGAALPLWFLGVVLGVAYEHTGSLLVPMTIHGCFNLATALALLLERGNPS